MDKTPTEIFNDKVSLICEYDKSSPLFVRQANTEIENNNVDRAIELLKSGIKLYPEYSTAYIILGRVYTLIGDYGRALQQIKIGSELIHSKRTYDYYLKEIENIKKQRSLFSESRGSAFIPEVKFPDDELQPGLFENEQSENKSDKKTDNLDERLDQLAQEISSARITESSGEIKIPEIPTDDMSKISSIVSETLAKIYVAQGEYLEAINVYKKLIGKIPAKEEDFRRIIKELKSKLDS